MTSLPFTVPEELGTNGDSWEVKSSEQESNVMSLGEKLVTAAHNGNAEGVKCLLQVGADVKLGSFHKNMVLLGSYTWRSHRHYETYDEIRSWCE